MLAATGENRREGRAELEQLTFTGEAEATARAPVQGAGWCRQIQTGKGMPPTPGGGGRLAVLNEEGEKPQIGASFRARDEDVREEAPLRMRAEVACRRRRAEVAAARAPVGQPA